jgi:hypothetical protein
VPWSPELFTAPALARIQEKYRRERPAAVPYFDGLGTAVLARIGDVQTRVCPAEQLLGSSSGPSSTRTSLTSPLPLIHKLATLQLRSPRSPRARQQIP